MVRLDIISDPICPWCYIGKANLDRALARAATRPFHIEWHPFQLNPEMPDGGMDRRAYLEAKFGGKDGAVQAYAPVVDHAKAAGLEINFEGIARTPNTLNAHRLIHWAGVEGRQTAVVSHAVSCLLRRGPRHWRDRDAGGDWRGGRNGPGHDPPAFGIDSRSGRDKGPR